MSNNLTPNGGPPDLAARFKAGLQQARASTVLFSSKPLLRLLKSGKLVFGQENNPVQPGSKWVFNVMSLQHGWSCWSDEPGASANQLLGETMVSVLDPKPVQPPPAQGKWPYREQFSADLKCISGEDAGTEVHYKTTALGGKRAFMESLIPAIERQIDIDPLHLCPVVKFTVDSYDHKKYGETFFPVLEFVGWVDMDGNGPSGPAIAQAKPVKPVEEAVEPVATAKARSAAPRRRPAGR